MGHAIVPDNKFFCSSFILFVFRELICVLLCERIEFFEIYFGQIVHILTEYMFPKIGEFEINLILIKNGWNSHKQ